MTANSMLRSSNMTLLAFAGTAILIAMIAIATDLSELFWHALRPFERWEGDELLLALSTSSFVAWIVSIVQIRSLSKKVIELETRSSDRQSHSISGDRLNVVAKCTYCSTYQVDDNQWLCDDEYIARQGDATVIAGVCPKCRVRP